MLINQGRIEIIRVGNGVKFVHRDDDGSQRRVLEKQHYMTKMSWRRAIEDWLANFDEDMPLKRSDGAMITVGQYEGDIA